MKKFVVSSIAFLALFAFIMFHSFSMVKLGDEIKELSIKAKMSASEEQWSNTLFYIEKITKLWEEKGIWTALTMRTDDLEEIEISLKQSQKYAELRDKNMFLGEFLMFSKLVEHIPHQEGFHIEELL